MIKRLTRALTAATLVLTVVACGGGSSNVDYYPVAYGIPGECFYLDSPLEAIALQQAGLCPSGWRPTLMPDYWHQRYYAYYASPTYYNTYVPTTYRKTYPAQQTAYYKPRAATINAAQKVATYKGSNGKTVTGDKIGVVKHGSGSRTKFGSGAACKSLGQLGEPTVTLHLSTVAYVYKTGSGSRTAPKVKAPTGHGSGSRSKVTAPAPKNNAPKTGSAPKPKTSLHKTGC